MLATKHACIRTGLVLSVALVGCSADRFAAESAGNIATTSSDAMRGFWDYDIARAGTASAIMQLEAMQIEARPCA